MPKKIIPLAGMVLVEDEEDKLSSGIVLAEEKDKQSQIGIIAGIGSYPFSMETLTEDYESETNMADHLAFYYSEELSKGDIIIYKKYSGSEVELEGKKYRLLGFSDIIGKIE